MSEQQILTRWRDYYDKISNEKFPRKYFPEANSNIEDVPEVSEEEVRDVVKRSKAGKALGPDQIPAEFWKSMGVVGIKFLTLLITILMRDDPMPEQLGEGVI